MPFNPLSNRDPDKNFDETDWVGGALLLASLLLLSYSLAIKVMTKESELKYLEQNNCKVKEYVVKTSTGSMNTLWICNKGKHYVGTYVS
jgi:hypothetical protein